MTGILGSCDSAKREVTLSAEHCRLKDLNNQAELSPTGPRS
jgi:hypothetical protein